MPRVLVDPTTAAQGAPGVPVSPLASMFSNSVAAMNSRFPTQEEQAKIDYLKSEAAAKNQTIGAGQELSDVFTKALSKPSGGPVPGVGPDGNPLPAAPDMSVDDNIRANMPALAAAVAHSGHVENLPALARMFSMYVPGAAANVAATKTGQPSIQDLAMMGAGDNANSTWGGVKQHEALDTSRQLAVEGARNQGQIALARVNNELGNTGEQKNRRVKIQALMDSQNVDYPTAEGIADGVIKAMPDQNGNMFLVNEATGTSKLLRSPAQGSASTPSGNNTVAGAPAPAAGGDGADYLTQLTTPRGAGPGAPGGEVPLTAKAGPAPTAKDLGIDFSNIYGGGATASRIAGGIYSAMGGKAGPGQVPTENLRKLQNVATQLIAIESLRPGMRSNGTGLKMLANQYPPTENSITEPAELADMATHDPQGAETAFNSKLADAVQNRLSDEQSLQDPNLSKEERQATKERVDMFDKLVKQQPAAIQQRFAAAMGRAPAEPAPLSNQDQLKAATTPGNPVDLDKAPGLADAKKLAPGSTFPDAKVPGKRWQVLPGGQFKAVGQ